MRSPFLSCGLAAIAIGFSLIVTSARADRAFFSTVGQPILADPLDPESLFVAPTPIDIAGTPPVITMALGEVKTLYVWYRFSNPPPTRTLLTLSLDVDSSRVNIAKPLGLSVFNSGPEDQEYIPRWDDPILLGSIGEVWDTKWVYSATGSAFNTRGIGNTLGSSYSDDPYRDSVSRSFLFAALTFEGVSPGTTGLYFRVGRVKILDKTGNAREVQFGGNTVDPAYMGSSIGSGDPITADLIFADAIINVENRVIPEPSTGILAAVAAASSIAMGWRRKAIAQGRG